MTGPLPSSPDARLALRGVTKLAPGSGPDGKRLLLQIGFTLEPGDGLAVIGSSGSGKTCLARLLTGLWHPDAGEIRLGGAAPDAPGAARIGYLPQQTDLSAGTLREIIAGGDAGARDRSVIAAAKLAGAHEMILALPDGYRTRVDGPNGPLSAGQARRIGLARALHGDPALVVLDEPDAHLDAEGVQILNRAIAARRAAGSTVVVMAHRPAAIAALNKVLVLRDGVVVQFNRTDEILAKAQAGQGGQQPAPRAARSAAPEAPAAPVAPAVSPPAPRGTITPIAAPRDDTGTSALRKLLQAERASRRPGPGHPFFSRPGVAADP